MQAEVLILREPEIRALLDPESSIAAMERAFAAYSSARAELPVVIHLDVPERRGEIHIKAGHLHDGAYYAVKMVSGFPGNVDLGLAANGGMVVVFDARTGSPAGLLLDNGAITDLRTAAAGSVAARHLARREVQTVAVIGTGAQAHCQIEMLAHVRDFAEVRIWGRDPAKARAVADESSRSAALAGRRFVVAPSVREAVNHADIVLTVTASRAPLVEAGWLASGATVIAVGSDAPGKQELAVAVLHRADRIVADSIPQCLRLGEIQHAADAIRREKITELGEIVSGAKSGRASARELIVCDLTGVGVQDVAAASLVMERALSLGRGERLKI